MDNPVKLLVTLPAGANVPDPNWSAPDSQTGTIESPADCGMAGGGDSDEGISVMVNPDILKGAVFLVFKVDQGEGYDGVCAMIGYKDQSAAELAFTTQHGEEAIGFTTEITIEDYRSLVSMKSKEGQYAVPFMTSIREVSLRKAAYPALAVKEKSSLKEGQELSWMGLDLVIETPAGSVRNGMNRDGKSWTTYITHHYGYFPDSVSMEEGEELDFFLQKDQTPSDHVYVIDCMGADGVGTDEEKVFLGFQSDRAARAAFLEMYDEEKLGIMYCMTMEDFIGYLELRAPEAIQKLGGTTEVDDQEEDNLDVTEAKSLTRKMLRGFHELKKFGVAPGKETLKGNIASLRFSMSGEGAGVVTGSPLLKSKKVLVELFGTGPTIGSVYTFGRTPTEALEKGLQQVELLKKAGLWNTERHQVRGRKSRNDLDRQTEMWKEAVGPMLQEGVTIRMNLSKGWSDSARAAAAAARKAGKGPVPGKENISEGGKGVEGGIASVKELDGLSSYQKQDDPLGIPGSQVTVKGDRVEIRSDDGNESSYGSEEWKIAGGKAILQESFGRDTFEGNFADTHFQSLSKEKQKEAEDKWGLPTEGYMPNGFEMPLKDFVAGVKQHVESWRRIRDRRIE